MTSTFFLHVGSRQRVTWYAQKRLSGYTASLPHLAISPCTYTHVRVLPSHTSGVLYAATALKKSWWRTMLSTWHPGWWNRSYRFGFRPRSFSGSLR